MPILILRSLYASNMQMKFIAFFALIIMVSFLQFVGDSYTISVLVSIERQFQIPSERSGMIISADDFGFIVSIMLLSYFGSKGNRAKWIGGGCVLIAFANMIIGSSHFLFPTASESLNPSTLETNLERDLRSLPANLTLQEFLTGIKDIESPEMLREKAILINRFFARKEDLNSLKVLGGTSYAFCDSTLNKLRVTIKDLQCANNDFSNMGPTLVIFLGLMLMGIGSTIPNSLGLPLIDDNVKKANLPIFMALRDFLRITAPLIGTFIGSFFNTFYYTGHPPAGITPKDPMWIGMWYGGFFLNSLLLMGPSIALLLFWPGDEAAAFDECQDNGKCGKKKHECLALVDRHLERESDSAETSRPHGVKEKVWDFFRTISTVFKQPLFRWCMAGRIVEVFAFKGFFVFTPKYLELQFALPQYKINQLLGVFGVVSITIGMFLGSLAMKFFKFQGKSAAIWVSVNSLIAAFFVVMNLNIQCASPLTSLGQSLHNNSHSNATCLHGCACDALTQLYPVCDMNGTVYYSPCHAGCKLNNEMLSSLEPEKIPIFESCECANGLKVSRKFCSEDDCGKKSYWYFANLAISGVIGGLQSTPASLIMLRSVPPEHRSISIGFFGFIVSIFATLPSPILWGAIFDKFCISWDTKCNRKGACQLYATDSLRIWLHYTYGLLQLISLIISIGVVYYASGLSLTEIEEQRPKKDVEDGGEFEESVV